MTNMYCMRTRQTDLGICDNLCSIPRARRWWASSSSLPFLFRGGHGAWQQFLAIATEWVWTVLHMSVDPAKTILRCSDSQQSTTRLEMLRFICIYRKVWARRTASTYIEGTGSSTSSSLLPCSCRADSSESGGVGSKRGTQRRRPHSS